MSSDVEPAVQSRESDDEQIRYVLRRVNSMTMAEAKLMLAAIVGREMITTEQFILLFSTLDGLYQ